MSDAREVGRITDGQGRVVIVGVNGGMVTLRTLGTRTGGAVELDASAVEELGQDIVAAAWQAGRDEGRAAAGGAAS